MAIQLWVNKYESIAVTESTSFSLLSISVFDGIAVSEISTLAYDPLNDAEQLTYSEVTVSESIGANIITFWHLRSPANIPLPLLSASFGTTLQLDSRLPTWSFKGQTGSQLDEKLPTSGLSGTIQESTIGFTTGSKLPVGTVSGSFGSRLNKKLPTWEISSILLSDYFTLDKRIPVAKLSANMHEQGSWGLDKKISPRTFVGSLDITDELIVVDSKIPGGFKLTASMYSNDTWQLEENIAVRELVSTLYSGGITLDEEIPLLVLSATMYGDTPEGSKDASVTSTYFDGVLRYIRP